MANRYNYQYDLSYKPKMVQIEGFVSVGTGGQVNFPDQSGLGTPSGGSVSTGLPRGLLPGQSTQGLPTGWLGGFSGCIGLLGAGVEGVQRVGTGLYALQLEDDYVRLDSVQVQLHNAGTGMTHQIVDHTVGLGNSLATGGMTGVVAGNNPKNTIFVQFLVSSTNLPGDIKSGGGFSIDLRLRDSLSGSQ